jgi:NADP-dependent 3-hydroxy acid dehydrogenase YdfG
MSENQKKIWITGASSGIGKALAEKFAAKGWKVAASARRKEILDKMSEHENIRIVIPIISKFLSFSLFFMIFN